MASALLLLALAGGVEPSAVIYKTEPRPLRYDAYLPANPGDDTASRGAVVFFHGGGWNGGSPGQFASHCEHLAELGIPAFTVEYRLRSKDQTPATACVSDAWDAWQHILARADEYGFDPARVAIGGGSAGGHIAACLGTGVVPPDDDTDLGALTRPCAMVLFNPGVCIAPFEGYEPIGFERATLARVGCEPRKLSPIHHIDADTPPTLIMHGTADTTIGIRSVALFVERLQQFGTQAELKRYPGAVHGFFNRGRSVENYEQTLSQMDAFLREVSVLAAEPTTVE